MPATSDVVTDQEPPSRVYFRARQRAQRALVARHHAEYRAILEAELIAARGTGLDEVQSRRRSRRAS